MENSTIQSIKSHVSWTLAACLLSWFVASPALAAVLPVSGTVGISIALLPPVTLSGSGIGSSVGGGIASHPALVGAGELVPIAPTFVGLALVTMPAGASLPAGLGAGANGIVGSAFFFGALGTPAGSVVLNPVGGGGSTSFAIGPLAGTLTGATWQGAVGIATAVVFSEMQDALAIPITVTATAYDNRTAGGVGTVQFVAPGTGQLGIFGAIPVYGVLTLTYTPEPGTIVLLGVGIAWLGALGRRRRRG